MNTNSIALTDNDVAERGVVSCALQGADIPALGPDWFQSPVLWELLAAYRESGGLGITELCAWLKERNMLDRLSPAFLFEVWRYSPSTAQAGFYVEALRKARLRRREQQFALGVLKRIEAAEVTADQLADAMEREVLALRDNLDGACDHVATLSDAALETVEELQCRVNARNKGKLPGIASGLGNLDSATNGFQKGRVYVFGARPGMGKTSLARQIMLEAAKTTPVYFLNLEMSSAQTFEALLATKGEIDFGRMQAGTLNVRDFARIHNTTRNLLNLPIYVDDRFLTAPAIEASVRRMVRRHGVGFFVLDYLQLIPAASTEEERNPILRIGNASNMLVRIAKDMKIPVIALAQLNRDAESGDAESLSRRHIRDCGQIEQDAWFIGLLGTLPDDNNEDAYTVNALTGERVAVCSNNKDTGDFRRIGIKIVKNRSGRPEGLVKLLFHGPHLTFKQLADSH
ncbi:hypothetical protein EBZ80_10520 [bacterium]|nr:hypothetical protein [bacterium]